MRAYLSCLVLFSLLVFQIAIVTSTRAQSDIIISYDYNTATLDTLGFEAFDSSLLSARTPFHLGSYDDIVENLSQSPPTDSIQPESAFSYPIAAEYTFDVRAFPLRTAVKIITSDSNSCSGIMVSRKHVLTAAHCLVPVHEVVPESDMVTVIPAYRGESDSEFGEHKAASHFLFPDWFRMDRDIALVELDTEIGDLTGWVGIGYDEDEELLDEVYHKFTYPVKDRFTTFEAEYNGDTMYHSYGIMDLVEDKFLGFTRTSGALGQSGSSVLRIVNEEHYTSYGVSVWAHNQRHARIDSEVYHAFLSVIENDTTHTDDPAPKDIVTSVFPNPFSYGINWKVEGYDGPYDVKLYSIDGRLVDHIEGYSLLSFPVYNPNISPNINWDSLIPGSYILIFELNGEPIGEHVIIKGG